MTKLGVLNALLALILGCFKPQSPIGNLNEGYALIFVEDVDGEGGTFSYDFGDLVVLDLKREVQQLLTDDKFFDYHPSFFGRESLIIFESKRSEGEYFSGISAHSRLFTVDAEGKITEFQPKVFVGSDKSKPSASPGGTRLAYFRKVRKERLTEIVVHDVEGSESFSFGVSSPTRIRWSHDGRFLVYSDDYFDGGVRVGDAVYVFRLENRTVVDTIYESGWSFSAADLCGDTLVFAGNETGVEKSASIFLMDFRTGTKTKTPLDDFDSVEDPVFDESGAVYFIGIKNNEKDYSSDIYRFDLNTRKIDQVTFNGHDKSCLVLIGSRSK